MYICKVFHKSTTMKRVFFLLSALLLAGVVSAQHRPNSEKTWAWLDFQRPEGVNPVLSPDMNSLFYCPMQKKAVAWEGSDTFNPAATVMNGRIVVLYRAEDHSGEGIGKRTSRIGYASSGDGIHFERAAAPVLYPGGDNMEEFDCPGGCEDPRVCKSKEGLYVMLYTSWNRQVPRLCVATSRDLVKWEKHGPAFAKAYEGRFANIASKSASLVTEVKNGEQTIVKMKGKYWMFWGEYFVNVATSENLIDWTPMLDEKGELLRSMSPREGYFDSMLTECGPPAILTKKGILLFYNGKNRSGNKGDTHFATNSYCAGQALFSKKDPTQLLDRLDSPFFWPQASFEKSGQYPDGTVFVEGLVPFQGKWFLYYGCADSRVSVAVYQ